MLKKQLDLLLNKEGLKTNIKETKKYVSNVSDTINQRIDEEVSALTETINTLDEKLDQNVNELIETIDILDDKVNKNHNELNQRIDTEVSALTETINALDYKVDKNVNELIDTIDILDDKVNDNYEDLKDNIKDTNNTINQRIDEEVSGLTETINALDIKADKNHEEIKDSISANTQAIEDLNSEISNKMNFTGVTNNQELIVNTPVGNLKVGDKIELGDSIFTVLTKLLTQIYPPSSVTPTCTIINNGKSFSTPYEVGTIVTPKLSYKYTDGKYSSYTSSIKYEVINANCTVSSVTYYHGNTELPDGTTNITLKDGNSSALKVSIKYNASTIKPKDSSLKEVNGIQSGTCSSSNTYKAYFKYFVGYTSQAQGLPKTSDDVRSLNKYSGFINTTSQITIVAGNTTSEAYNLIVCVPKGGSVSAETVGVTGNHNFIKGNEIVVNVGGTTTQKYSVFYVEGTPVYKNLKITKGTITNN